MSDKALTRRTALSGAVVLPAVLPTAVRTALGGQPAEAGGIIRHGFVEADGVRVFYREAGQTQAPVLLLLHGFANSSFYFRHLTPRLASRYRLIAPDLPSFGFTVVPTDRHYRYDFQGLTRTIQAFVDALGLTRFAIYVFD
jgi:pimeloyl-ACP methyl ester carboxylesterase